MTQQYLELGKRILTEGEWVYNERTNTKTLTLINHDLTYDVSKGEFPLVTTRKSFWKAAVAELLGYIREYDNANDFTALGTPTWTANANNPVWTSNPHYKGDGDMGKVYGVIGNDFGGVNQFLKVYNNLKNGIDDRGEIITYWKPDDFDKGCLRPCMHSFQFSLVNGTLYLNATQRSCDVPLGLNFNMVQCYVFLAVMAQITGHKPGKVFHKIVNAHLYENQVKLFEEQMYRTPFNHATFSINPDIKTWEDLLKATPDDFVVTGYAHHEPIKYPFTV